MKITSIKETGANNTLLWAIANGGDPRGDEALTSLINDDLCYLVTISGLNFLEVIRLTQMYREKLRIINEYQADIPSRKELLVQFNGNFNPDPNDPNKHAPLWELVEAVCGKFMDLAKQMSTDEDIMSPRAQRLFIPMLCRKFDVQIPVGFYDFVTSMNAEEAADIFNSEYPNTLNKIIEAEVHGVKTTLALAIVRATQNIRYNKRYEQYLDMIKYLPLKKQLDKKTLYKFGMLGFHKYDNITRGEVRCNLTPIPPANDDLVTCLKRLSSLSTPLKISFALQLPLQYIQIIENAFPADVLEIHYESSMANIINTGISFDDFIEPIVDPESTDPQDVETIEKFNNAVSAYKTRINEANQYLLNILPIFLENPGDVDIVGTFAMLPSIYAERCVVTLNLEHAAEYSRHSDPLVAEMFRSMLGMAESIVSDINKAK